MTKISFDNRTFNQNNGSTPKCAPIQIHKFLCENHFIEIIEMKCNLLTSFDFNSMQTGNNVSPLSLESVLPQTAECIELFENLFISTIRVTVAKCIRFVWNCMQTAWLKLFLNSITIDFKLLN